jgi:hypothetical protein
MLLDQQVLVRTQELEAGQSKQDKGTFLSVDKLPAGAKPVLLSVERTASI